MALSGSEDVDAPEQARRPRIGISTYLELARWGAWDQPATLLPHVYVDAVYRAGGVPVLLPPLPGGADEAIDGVAGLVLAGGADVGPDTYGAVAAAGTDQPRRDRDAWEFALLEAALAQATPVLGVCRGAQVLNVCAGGTLHQHLPDVVGTDAHRPAPGQFARVSVTVAANSTLAGILGPEVDAPCSHHQAIDRLGAGVSVSAWAPDGTIEAVELPGHEHVIGVQWHPELDAKDLRLFGWLVAAAQARMDPSSPPAGHASGRRPEPHRGGGPRP